MTEIEVKKILATMITAYPNYKPENMSFTVEIWMDMLSDFEYRQVAMALKAYIMSDKSGFAPSIGALIDKIGIAEQPEYLNEQEAWSIVANALRNSAYHSSEEFAKLPDLVQRGVGQASQLRFWAMDEAFNEEVAKASFQRAYRIEVARAKEISKLPKQMKVQIAELNKDSNKSKMIEKSKPIEQELLIEDMKEYIPMPDRFREKMDKIGEVK